MREFLGQLPVAKIISCAIVAAVAAVLIICLSKIYKRFRKKHGRNDATGLMRVIFGVLRFAIILLAIILALQIWGVNVSSAVAGLGVASAIVGLALQDILKDVIMGIHIMADHFYCVGDGVEYNGERGIVRSFSMMTTKIELFDGSVVSVCNRNIDKIKKISHIVSIDIPLSYDENPEKVHKTLKKVSDKIGKLQNIESCSYKGTQDFADSAILYRICFFTHPQYSSELRRSAIGIIQDELLEADIQIPYSRMDVHVEQ